MFLNSQCSLPAAVFALVSAAGLGACGGPSGAKDLQDLGERVLAAIQTKDLGKLQALIPTPALLKTGCPNVSRDEARVIASSAEFEMRKLAETFEHCIELDLTDATIVARRGGERQDLDKGCEGARAWTTVILKLQAGSRKVRIELESPVEIGGAFYALGVACSGPASDPMGETIEKTIEFRSKVIALLEANKNDPGKAADALEAYLKGNAAEIARLSAELAKLNAKPDDDEGKLGAQAKLNGTEMADIMRREDTLRMDAPDVWNNDRVRAALDALK